MQKSTEELAIHWPDVNNFVDLCKKGAQYINGEIIFDPFLYQINNLGFFTRWTQILQLNILI